MKNSLLGIDKSKPLDEKNMEQFSLRDDEKYSHITNPLAK